MVVAQDRFRARITRLEALGRVDEDAREAMGALHQSGLKPPQILIRSSFVRLDEPLDVEHYSDRQVPPCHLRPPMTRLMRSRGIALQLFLTAIFEVQCRIPAGREPGVNNRSLAPPPSRNEKRQYGWAELVGASTGVTSGRVTIGSNAVAKRLRQIRQALSTLSSEDLGLIIFTESTSARGRYERFRLSHEGRRRRGGEPLPYAVPDRAEAGLFGLDARLFTNGWIHVLEESELSFLCMLADMHARAGTRDALAIPGQVRIGYYGLGLDGYRSHQLLSLAGLIDVEIPEGRRPDGTFKNYSDPEWFGSGAPPHRFQLRDDGIAVPALPTVLAALKRLSVPRRRVAYVSRRRF